ncbi:MAG: glycerol-3-phosphate 1-O-acyltransferase PlsY [Desulfobacteraceae bacterium]|nr:glycerol-3-phosphate 1-O-acyltransferase PlsY [Desulfobacteraceae bacterium]
MEYCLVALGYLIGSIPFGLVLGKCLGIDIRRAGSGNIGATNVNRLLGKKMGAITLLADAGKAVLPMLAAARILGNSPSAQLWVAATGGAAFLGHLYPLYLKFKGGKGVATALGIFFYIHPLALAICILIFVAVVRIWGYVSLGSLTAALMMPALVFCLDGPGHKAYLALLIAALIWLKHADNLRRLIKHQENSIWKKAGNGPETGEEGEGNDE